MALNRGNPMRESIDSLYATFAHYRLGRDFTGCDCCVRPEDSARLAARPIRELTYQEFERYSRKAMSTWGDARHFKYFLPRLLELTIAHRDGFLDLAVVFGKVRYAEFESWPQHEQSCVNQFFDAYWVYQLGEPLQDAFQDSIDTVLCALANALPSVQRFLDVWIAQSTKYAKRHLAAFILTNEATLLSKRRLSNAFWDTKGKPHDEVIHWIQSKSVLQLLESGGNTILGDDFSYAHPQLLAIRSVLAGRQE